MPTQFQQTLHHHNQPTTRVVCYEHKEDLDSEDEHETDGPSEASRFHQIKSCLSCLNPLNWTRKRVLKLMQGALLGVMIGSVYVTYFDPILCTCTSSDVLSSLENYSEQLLNLKNVFNVTDTSRCLERVSILKNQDKELEKLAFIINGRDMRTRCDDSIIINLLNVNPNQYYGWLTLHSLSFINVSLVNDACSTRALKERLLQSLLPLVPLFRGKLEHCITAVL